MSLLNFITRVDEKRAVASVIDQLAKDLPPALLGAGRSKVSVNKVTRHLERAYATLSDLRMQRQIGFVGRAIIANTFKWGLKERGYPVEFVDMATEGLIVALSKKHG